jgi:hypothetical protein
MADVFEIMAAIATVAASVADVVLTHGTDND